MTGPQYGGITGVKVRADAADITVTSNWIVDHHSAGWAWGVVLTPSGSTLGIPEIITLEGNDNSELNDGSVYDVFGRGERRA